MFYRGPFLRQKTIVIFPDFFVFVEQFIETVPKFVLVSGIIERIYFIQGLRGAGIKRLGVYETSLNGRLTVRCIDLDIMVIIENEVNRWGETISDFTGEYALWSICLMKFKRREHTDYFFDGVWIGDHLTSPGIRTAKPDTCYLVINVLCKDIVFITQSNGRGINVRADGQFAFIGFFAGLCFDHGISESFCTDFALPIDRGNIYVIRRPFDFFITVFKF